jgi:tripartite-type tricarboxylate transporter receptor subunit TctC
MTWLHRIAIATALLSLSPEGASADSVADFYRGRTITISIGVSPGGGYDLYARALAQFMRKHIPGQPLILPQNMPGAGTLRAASYVFSAAPKDGTALATFARNIPTLPLFSPSATFDARRFTWIGSIASDTSLCITRADSPIKTWQDMLDKTVVMGGQFDGSDANIFAKLYRNLLGAKIKLVPGYPGTAEVALAIERSEIEGVCGLSLGGLIALRPEWINNKFINILMQAGLTRDAKLPDVPLITELISDPEKQKILNLFLAPMAMGRPFAGSPDIPADRKAALRKAFDDTMKDPEFLAATAAQQMEVSPMSGEQIEQLVQQLWDTPPDIIHRAAEATAK